MGDKTTTTKQKSWSRPIFSPEARELLDSLSSKVQTDPRQTPEAGFFLNLLQGVGNDRLQQDIANVTKASDMALPKDLAVARSFTRNRPDTFSSQTAANVTADNRTARDLAVGRLLLENQQLGQQAGIAGASGLANLSANNVGQQLNLLSLLRGEEGENTSRSKTRDPWGTAIGMIGALGGAASGVGAIMNG